MAAVAAASAALIGGTGQADEPSNQAGPPGEGGSATVYCWTSEPPQDDTIQMTCAAPSR
jgi:hypothetical protein